ncbi:hypothetical protein JG687_00015247 [Phytophthora cactorum]|uniref:Uncharacterized protein n=1 Tax=Phytophthora cactorum TaxID=29920 RepID=A0A329RX49_9STRA|nr:hypothetical protein Pcac1_g16722 [Phytophthora cactorum]KAG2776184.1 hypothetical protein Pcac1_g13400 [Phytophthora cactorum]KAG2804806.1 hypothetical protein PC112_g18556 [Phytophthora cactorum]KAG2806112.1 hypothetical protein PC111_g17517 [Phytophthora cactorum]KAG2843915.1 hypothetical protein PC113_g18509 [Phytophthora cactorum]
MTEPSSHPNKAPKTSATQQQDEYRTLQSVAKLLKAETPRKRPFKASKLAALRSIKRRLEDSGTAGKRPSDPGGVESRVITRTRGSGQQNNGSPVLLEESRYWLVVQRFSQLT